jgi:hypothetical protein
MPLDACVRGDPTRPWRGQPRPASRGAGNGHAACRRRTAASGQSGQPVRAGYYSVMRSIVRPFENCGNPGIEGCARAHDHGRPTVAPVGRGCQRPDGPRAGRADTPDVVAVSGVRERGRPDNSSRRRGDMPAKLRLRLLTLTFISPAPRREHQAIDERRAIKASWACDRRRGQHRGPPSRRRRRRRSRFITAGTVVLGHGYRRERWADRAPSWKVRLHRVFLTQFRGNRASLPLPGDGAGRRGSCLAPHNLLGGGLIAQVPGRCVASACF